jgi:hypothetical protein
MKKSSSPSIFRPYDFPNLKDARQSSKKKKKFGPLFDSADWNFKYTTKRKEFPFDEVADEALKIKFAPIRLCWPLHEQNRVVEQGRPRSADLVFSIRGHFRKEKWFRSPPKVCIVPGILGAHPSQGTRGINRDTVEREVDDDALSGHCPPVLFLGRDDRHLVDVIIPNPKPPIPTSTSLATFVKHFWKGAALGVSMTVAVVVEIVTGATKIVVMNLAAVGEVVVEDSAKIWVEVGMEQGRILRRGRMLMAMALIQWVLSLKKRLRLKIKPSIKSRSMPSGKGRRTKKRNRPSGVPRMQLWRGKSLRGR